MGKSSTPYIARGAQRYRTVKTAVFNIDNGAGVTIDDILFCLDQDVEIISVHEVYTEATDTTGAASANYKVGTTLGGAEIVAAKALKVATAIGGYGTNATLVNPRVPAHTAVFVRHTGIAATEVGQYYVQVEYMVKP